MSVFPTASRVGEQPHESLRVAHDGFLKQRPTIHVSLSLNTRNMTAELGVKLVLFALGKSVL